MKKGISYTLLILFSLLMLLPFLGRSQATYTAPIGYNTGAPTAAPSASGTRWRFDLLTGRTYKWSPTAASWILDGYGIDNVTGCIPPAYTPAYGQSIFAVNGCDSLYGYRAGHWRHLNPGGSGGGTNIYAGSGITFSGISPDITINADDVSAENELNTALYVDAGSLVLDDAGGSVSTPLSQFRQGIYSAGTGIGLNLGTGAISNTGDLSTTNEIQTLSISGQDLSLSLGGGTVTIPGGTSLGTGFTAGGGSGTIPDGTVAVRENSKFYYGYDGNPDAIAWLWDDGSGFYNRILNNADGLDVGSFDDNSGASMRMSMSGGSGNFSASNGTLTFNAKSNGTISFDQQTCFLRFSNGDDNVVFEDTRGTPKGIEYAADYSADLINNPQSFADVATVNLLIVAKAFNGNHTATGTATTAFTVTLPTTQPDATYSVSIMPKNALSATGWYISARTTTDFTVTYLTALTGAVDFDYIIVN
jgi:hypothetical protein